MKVKCVIFDMDGLMFDTEKIGGECFKAAALEFGYQVSDKIRFELLGRSKQDNYQILKGYFGSDYPSDKVSELSLKKRNEYIDKYGLPVKPGLKVLLQYLKEHHILTAVASSSNYDMVCDYLKMSNVFELIDYVVAGDQVSHSKPDPEIFLNVVKHFKIKVNEALVLEDSQNGILAAYNGNIPVICIPDLVRHKSSINELCLAVLNDLNEVVDYLRWLNKSEMCYNETNAEERFIC